MRLDWTFWLPLLAGGALTLLVRLGRGPLAVVPSALAGTGPEPATRRPSAGSWYALTLAGLTVIGLGVRLWLFVHLAAEPTGETLGLMRACEVPQSIEAEHIGTQAHAPLHSLLLRLFILLVEPLSGDGLSLVQLRLPNLLLAALAILLTARVGRTIASPIAGLGAAAVVAVAPFVLIMSVPQENYLLEMVAALWFCDRAAAYIVLRRPVHHTLVLSAAVAVWSGYLNVIVVGPLGLVALVVMWRRGERARAVATALSTLLLLLPVLITALRALSTYVALTGGAGVATEETAARAHELQHPVMYLDATFSRGRFWPGLVRVSEAMFGAVWWLVLVGFAGLLLARRWLTLVLAAPLPIFPALGCFIVINPQNYALTLPFFALVVACGVAALVGLIRPVRLSRVAHAGAQLAALGPALWLGHLALPVSGPGSRYQLRFVFDEHPAELLRLLQQNPAAPVLTYTTSDYGFVNQYLCARTTKACERARCMMQGGERRPLGNAIELVERGGTRTMVVRRDPTEDAPQLRDAVRDAVRAAEFSAKGLVVLRPSNPRDQSPKLTLLDEQLRKQCQAVAHYQPADVLWCPPGTQL